MIFSERGVFVMIDLFECCGEIASVGIIVDFSEDTETYIVGTPADIKACAHILAVVFSQPNCAPPQISGECGKTLTLVSCHSIFICGSDTGNDKRLVDIHPAADTINDFKHNTSPQNSI